jgi:RNA polymerase sigma-70 factor (family 1)
MTLNSVIDKKLVESWRLGNEKAFEELFHRYFTKLYAYALKFISDRSVAEETVMDVMFTVWQKKQAVNADLSLSAYLFKSVRNRVIDHFRKQSIKTISIEDTNYEPVSSFCASSRVKVDELETLYRSGLEKLPPQKKRIFAMSREDGNSYREIADKLELSKNTVENHMVAAIRIMKNHMRSAVFIN